MRNGFTLAAASLLLTALLPSGSAATAATDAKLASRADAIMQARCMVCHGCYDAPCQLKLEAREGLTRGASKDLVYDSGRLVAGNMSRLFDDALTVRQWQARGFYPVIDELQPGQGVLQRMLDLKQAHPLPADGPLPEGFDFSLQRDQQCPKQQEFDQFVRDFPLWGMPYGLPGLNQDEHRTMTRWLAQGAPQTPPTALSAKVRQAVADWERFLNGGGSKQKLMSRYLYEHLFLASLHFDEASTPAWFRLVRSHSPPGRNIGLIATRRPYDDPGTDEFYYRLQRLPVTALAKTHMPYRLDAERMAWFRELFLTPDYPVTALPGYAPEIAANPFKSFQAIPVKSRYKFLLGEAQFTIMNFIKGPVCRGQIALNVIDDHFWVMFTDPDNGDPEKFAAFLARESDNLRLPLAKTGTVIDLLAWRRYARSQKRYQEAKAEFVKTQLMGADRPFNLNNVWDGEQGNDNAALTIFRHLDTASVVKGFVGEMPKTAWLIDYSLLERIHYLLVAGFDVYGAVSHQLESRLYMDFLRMEGEYNFLMLLPPAQRIALRDFWYREARESSKQHFVDRSELLTQPNDIEYRTDDPKTELLDRLRERIHGARASAFDYRLTASSAAQAAFEQLEQNRGQHNSFLPQVSFLNVLGAKRDEVYTIIRNSGYANIAQIFREDQRRRPQEDNLTVVSGFLGAYPNYFFQIPEGELQSFADQIADLNKQQDFQALLDRFGVRRNAPWFWRLSDKFHRMQREQDPIAAGLFDYNRYLGY